MIWKMSKIGVFMLAGAFVAQEFDIGLPAMLLMGACFWCAGYVAAWVEDRRKK
jgi:hypothetical protein